MYKTFHILLLVVGLTVAFACATGHAQAPDQTVWNNAGVGDWTVVTNWDDAFAGNSFPEGAFDAEARVNNGGTAFVDTTISPIPGNLIILSNSTVEIRSGGDLTVDPDGGALPDGTTSIGSGGTLSMQGGVLQTVSLRMPSASTLEYDISTPPVSAPITVIGTANNNLELFAGTLAMNFSSPVSGGTTIPLIDVPTSAVSIQNFGGVNVTGLAAQTVTTSIANLGGGNSQVQATVTDLLTLQVDRDSGTIRIDNTHTPSISLDSYTIESAAGSLNAAGLSGLGAGWTAPGTNSSNAVSESNQDSSSTLSGSSMTGIGSLFSAASPTSFGQVLDDLTFTYRTTTGDIREGVVVYDGTPTFNDIVLTIDPNSNGDANIKNFSPFTQDIEAYRITSSDSSLDPNGWNSFEDQALEGGTWGEVPPTSSTLVEFQGSGTTTMNNFTVFDIGELFDPNGDQDGVTFEYLLAGDSEFTEGVVHFGELPVGGIPGDFNDDGRVDAADFLEWQRNPSIGDLSDWEANYGNPIASNVAAVPEPSTLVLLIGSTALLGGFRSKRQTMKSR